MTQGQEGRKDTDERSVKRVADFLAEDCRATCEDISQSTEISPKSVFRILTNIFRKERFVPDESLTV
jgi:Mn-dependent DtxR family transcriptional regulator